MSLLQKLTKATPLELYIEYVLFDVDGTLVNTNYLIIEAFKHTFKKHLNMEISASDLVPFFGEPLHVTFARFTSDLIGDMVQTFQEFDLAHHRDMVDFFPRVPETIAELYSMGVHLAIITSKQQLAVNTCDHIDNIRKYFGAIVTIDNADEPKPSPKPIQKALEQLGYTRGKVLMVGDSPLDIKSARNAGVLSAVVSWTMYPMEKIMAEQPDYVLTDLYELLKICRMGGDL